MGNINPEDIESRRQAGIGTLERYTGSEAGSFQQYVLLTNFERYVKAFSKISGATLTEGTAMQAAHWPEEKITMISYGVGSPTAALIIDLLHFISPEAVLMLGLCGGLRIKHNIGDYFLPVAAVRGEGTSDHYLPPQVPSLSNFTIQRYVAAEMERRKLLYHTGVIHSTNFRFWEFDEVFKERLLTEKAQTIDMECATLFTVGYARQVPVGALMLISDRPLVAGGVKTPESSKRLFEEHSKTHIEIGAKVLMNLRDSGEIAHKEIW